jgi:hypothetical protein
MQIFFVPGLRHAWHWLGLRPVSRKSMAKLLSSGSSVALCPGGVQVCGRMPVRNSKLGSPHAGTKDLLQLWCNACNLEGRPCRRNAYT